MKTTRLITKSPLRLAETALAVAREALPPYSCKYARKVYTQHQLFALLALRSSSSRTTAASNNSSRSGPSCVRPWA